MAHADERVVRVRPAAHDGINVVFLARRDAERSEHLADPISIEVRVRDTDFRPVTGGECRIIVGRAESKARVVDRAEREGDRGAGDEHPREFGETRPEFGQGPVQVRVRRKRADEVPPRELGVRGFFTDLNDVEARGNERARIATAAGSDLDDRAAWPVKNFDQPIRKRMGVLR